MKIIKLEKDGRLIEVKEQTKLCLISYSKNKIEVDKIVDVKPTNIITFDYFDDKGNFKYKLYELYFNHV